MIDRGLILTAVGERYKEEALASAKRIRHIWPEIDVTVFQAEPDDRPVQLWRMESMAKSPYERTLSLDADTWMVDPVPELFEVLDQFDCALPTAPIRHVYPTDTPECFYEFCPAVFAYRRSDAMSDFFEDWGRRFRKHYQERQGVSHPEIGWFHSQPSFTEAIYHSDLRIAPLQQEYNWQGTGYVQEKVKITHKRPHPDEEAERINVSLDKPRVALLFSSVFIWS